MKKLLLVCLMMLASSAWAEWQEFIQNDTSVSYIDLETIRKDGNLRKIWVLLNYAEKDINGKMSARTRQEFDCKEERRRVLTISTHSEAMAGGKQLFSHTLDTPKWEEIPPNTNYMTLLKLVCAK